MDLGLKGLNALVTGGSKGIGRRCADIFADEGANVAVCARQADEVAAAVSGLQAKGVKGFGQAVDVADKAALEGWDVQGQAEDADVTLLGFSVRVHDVPLKGTDPGGGAGSGAVRRRMPGHRRPSSGSFEGVKVPIRA